MMQPELVSWWGDMCRNAYILMRFPTSFWKKEEYGKRNKILLSFPRWISLITFAGNLLQSNNNSRSNHSNQDNCQNNWSKSYKQKKGQTDRYVHLTFKRTVGLTTCPRSCYVILSRYNTIISKKKCFNSNALFGILFVQFLFVFLYVEGRSIWYLTRPSQHQQQHHSHCL